MLAPVPAEVVPVASQPRTVSPASTVSVEPRPCATTAARSLLLLGPLGAITVGRAAMSRAVKLDP